jgi:hypothetical protein
MAYRFFNLEENGVKINNGGSSSASAQRRNGISGNM